MKFTAEELQRRVITPEEFVADPTAFVDVRLPQSKGKESYSFIGPGVSQNSQQVINLIEPHGFNVGAAALPAGALNNPHLHFTAEVFICMRGHFRFTVGLDHQFSQGQKGTAVSIEVNPGDVFSVPTWVFRSFENIGTEEGWVYTCLGQDVTGGIIWAPSVLDEAAETGLHLDRYNRLIDTVAGESLEGVELMPRMTKTDIDRLAQPTATFLETRLVTQDDLIFDGQALLSVAGTESGVGLARVIGPGMNQSRPALAQTPITNPHGFSLEWLRLDSGATIGLHLVDRPQVAYVINGSVRLEVNTDAGSSSEALQTDLPEGSVVSLPAGTWRRLRNVGEARALVALASEGDDRARIHWSSAVEEAALDRNLTIDADGYIAPAHLVDSRGG